MIFNKNKKSRKLKTDKPKNNTLRYKHRIIKKTQMAISKTKVIII
jgi:hypothetical protein